MGTKPYLPSPIDSAFLSRFCLRSTSGLLHYRAAALKHLAQLMLQGGTARQIGFIAHLVNADHVSQHVHRLQQHGNDLGGDGSGAGADSLQQGLHQMGKFRDRLKSEGTAAPLDRMGTAENHVDHFGIIAAVIQLQQGGLHVREVLKALFKKDLMELCDVHCHGNQPSTRLTVETSCSGLKGLTIQPVAPAALPSCFLSAADSVVSVRMGVNL